MELEGGQIPKAPYSSASASPFCVPPRHLTRKHKEMSSAFATTPRLALAVKCMTHVVNYLCINILLSRERFFPRMKPDSPAVLLSCISEIYLAMDSQVFHALSGIFFFCLFLSLSFIYSSFPCFPYVQKPHCLPLRFLTCIGLSGPKGMWLARPGWGHRISVGPLPQIFARWPQSLPWSSLSPLTEVLAVQATDKNGK